MGIIYLRLIVNTGTTLTKYRKQCMGHNKSNNLGPLADNTGCYLGSIIGGEILKDVCDDPK